ncbi:uncharacterized protein LOC129320222 [Prosopis cineraria]|uniref:uncharacterized protein LOC129298231 n=1 Tax=Prosopis cineraria TaxID=364024 RepID=UPI00240EFA3B|nr:uncharacterized protein LOC129298231 [Prosopis cineraria]XP_054821512.1 uncharacterized protein LOC129320222 [Prosopis cineraria]
MMNSSNFFLCCLVTVALYFTFHHTGPSLDVMPKPGRKLSMSIPLVQHEDHKIKVADEAMESSSAEDDPMALQYTSNSSNPHDLVYHIDYHGVTTHPTPKHPRP